MAIRKIVENKPLPTFELLFFCAECGTALELAEKSKDESRNCDDPPGYSSVYIVPCRLCTELELLTEIKAIVNKRGNEK